MTERERLINSATDWCSRLFDYEVRGNGLTGFEGQALDIIKGLLILVEPEAASGASVPHPQELVDKVMREMAIRHGSSNRRDFEVACLFIELAGGASLPERQEP